MLMIDVWYFICGTAAFLAYVNTLTADFVYDDRRAILTNNDVSTAGDIWRNDFWGTPLSSSNSHGSYRPLCVLSFRLNYLISGFKPQTYHATNIFLHIVATCLVYKLAKMITPAAVISGMLFAVHPVHTEAVAGLVGRADVLAAIFYLLAILCYFKLKSKSETKCRSPKIKKCNMLYDEKWSAELIDLSPIQYVYLMLTILFAVCSMLCKEIGITVLPICIMHEILLNYRRKLKVKNGWKTAEVLLLSTLALLTIRFKISNPNSPSFSTADNPIAKCSFIVKLLTFFYLPVLNFKLLLYPQTLSFDWGMDAVDKITTFFDSRNLVTLAFYSILLFSIRKSLTSLKNGKSNTVFVIFMMIIPYVPASNLFFHVGFVIAERILYIPSIGYCFMVAFGYHTISKCLNKFICEALILLLIGTHAIRTIYRNYDWQNEESLYRSGITVNPPKAYGNLGSILSSEGRLTEAEAAFRMALKYRSNMADVHYNLGLLLEKTNRSTEAVNSYRLAINYRPSLAVAYVKLGQLLLNLSREQEASEIFQKCSELDGTGLKDPKNHEIAKIEAFVSLASIQSRNGFHHKALATYKQALLAAPTYYKPQVIFNCIGETLIKMERYKEAEMWFGYVTGEHDVDAFEFLNSEVFVNDSKTEKIKWLTVVKNYNFEDIFMYTQYGQLLMNVKKYSKAAQVLQKVADKMENNLQIISKLASAYRLAGCWPQAEDYYRKLISMSPDATTYGNLGAVLFIRGKYKESDMLFRKSLKLEPNDIVTLSNYQKLKIAIRKTENNTRLKYG